jgi:hypothetical protein
MRWSELIASMVMIGVVPIPAAAVGQADGKRPAPRRDQPAPRPSWREVSASEQSAWIDENLLKLLSATAASPEVRVKIASSLPLGKAPPSFPLMPHASGAAQGDLEPWSALVHAAVAANPRYGPSGRAKPRPTVAVMPHTGIVRVEVTYPAPAAEKDLEPGPLTIDAWVCPDRETAMALVWLRRWGIQFLVPSPSDDLAKSVAAARDFGKVEAFAKNLGESSFGKVEAFAKNLGESSYWLSPGLQNALPLTKADAPIPADRVSFLRGNVVVEASTVEFVWDEEQKKWLASFLNQCAPDVVVIMRAIDAGFVRFGKPEEPKPK